MRFIRSGSEYLRVKALRYTLPDIEDQGGITFTAMSRVAEAFGDEFPHFNDKVG